MAFAAVTWDFKDEATAAKLAQMVENDRVHDHRADGSQGAPLVGNWIDCTADLTPGPGFTLSGVQRYCVIAGRLIAFDFRVQRTGVDLNAAPTGLSKPGAVTDTLVVNGLPADAIPGGGQNIAVDWTNALLLATYQAGGFYLTVGGAAAHVDTNDLANIKGVLWKA